MRRILLQRIDDDNTRGIVELDLRSYRQHLAVVPQQTLLFSGSVRDNITYGVVEKPPVVSCRWRPLDYARGDLVE